ncbi:MAG: copper-containing nitrite reductase [Limisphaerales bacterium]
MNFAKKLCSLGLVLAAGAAWTAASEAPPAVNLVFSTENAVLAEAPNVPPPILRTHASRVIVNLEVKEVTKRLADGVQYTFWTFGGNVPGSFIRVREGDLVKFHLHNNQNNKMPHNIDLHAVTGPGGGAASSFTAPGHSSQFSFEALKPGLYIYHCATAPVGMHVANGMYGLILVQPKEGLPPVDHEYYVMQGEFYTGGKFDDPGLQTFDLDKAIDERPSYVVFNGSVGSLTGSNALTARVGDKIRLFVGNGGPNLSSSFHLIGTIFDTVYAEGGSAATHHVQTTEVPPGGAAIVELTAEVPGNYTLVDHSLFRAFNKGAIGTLTVTGPENRSVYSGKEADTIYNGAPIATEPAIPAPQRTPDTGPSFSTSLGAQYARGRGVYMQTCFVCHQPNGRGIPGQIPPLENSDVLMNDRIGAIRGVIQGRNGALTVNGKKYNGVMIPFPSLSDRQIADVMTYVRNSWGNSDTNTVTPREVGEQRKLAPVAVANAYE